MFSIIHYISASRRLASLEQTIELMKNDPISEDDVPPMLLAQREMLKHEKAYFNQQVGKFLLYLILFSSIGLCLYASFVELKGH